MSNSLADLIIPDWPAPNNVRAYVSTRKGGESRAPYHSLNLGDHVGDSPEAVLANREYLASKVGLSNSQFAWLKQVHGTDVINASSAIAQTGVLSADGSCARVPNEACVVMTADCLPILLCDQSGQQVAAVHAGWRGLLNGVIEAALATFDSTDSVMAWLGPAIGPEAFEVGQEVYDAFIAHDENAAAAFSNEHAEPGKFFADIYHLATMRLNNSGISNVYGGGFCTVKQSELFYSFRRDGAQSGRMASFIFLSKT